ncbi:MAG TPA: adenylate/guanylate cyclase domain-containing protein [Polyangiales bacterium]|nr:adenylate/guanylate cyclase domain-containing protein [Polyangiales bacterium]
MPSFDELLLEVQRVLERDGRTSYRALKRRFELDDEYLEDLKEELIVARGVARDEDGRVLVWLPPPGAASVSAHRWSVPAGASVPPQEAELRPAAAHNEQRSHAPPLTEARTPPSALAEHRERRPPSQPLSERRQLTVMFCDLVSSTELASRLDPEEYGEILAGYHSKCAEAIMRYGGHIAQYLGDGVHAYFGYPHAQEDAATRAVHAGLLIIDQLRRAAALPTTKLAVRVGIHTGTVVMGDVGDAQHLERMAMGDVPSVAARVQSAATTNSIAITQATRTLLRDEFMIEPIGVHSLKGVPKPLPLFRVVGASGGALETTHSETPQPPLFGRDAELSLLRSRFLEAQKGAGQIVALSGEPGIGKSRVLRAFRESLREHTHTYWEIRCSAYHTGTALYPLTELIRRHFYLREGEPERVSLEKLRRGFANAGHAATALPLLASLLSIGPLPPEVASLTRVQQRRKLIEMFVAFFLERAQREVVVLALDDLHWSDPSTLEFLAVLSEQVPATRVLLVTGFRPNFELQWQVRDRITVITLDRLTPAQAAALIERVAQGKRLPARLQAELLDKTDGVPLFIEESTRMLLDSPCVVEHDDHYELSDIDRELGVPSSIQDSLMARLDQLTSAKEVAQLAAIIGRTFHYELIAALWTTEERLRAELSRLVQAGLLLQRGLPPEAVFSFKHALIQDVSYASTLKRVRRSTHSEVAKLLLTKFPQIAAAEPELIAHHFSEAGLTTEAVLHWQRAADKALSAFANVEAVRHLQRALTLLPSLPAGPARDDLELTLLTTLGTPLIATQGFSAPEVKRAYERAYQLCQALDDPMRKWSVLFGTFYYHSARGDGVTARSVGRELARLARTTGDSDMRLELCTVQGHELWFGQLSLARGAFEAAIEMYDTLRHAGHAAQYGQDPFVVAHAYLGGISAIQGQPEQAREHTRRALAHARRIEHPHSLGFALAFASTQCQLSGDYAGARDHAVETRTVAAQHCLATWLAYSDILQGWAEVMQDGTSEGLARLQEGLRAYELLGSRLSRTYQLGLLAEAHLRLNQPKRALEAIMQAHAQLESNGERYFQAELLRLEGEARLALDPRALPDANSCFQRALHVAREQGARGFEQRALEALERHKPPRRSEPDLGGLSRSDAN